MSSSVFSPESRINEHVFRLVSSLLVATMLTCATLTFVSLLGHIYSNWHPWYLGAASFIIALDCQYSHRSLHKLNPFSREWLFGFGSQWLIILVVLRVTIGFSKGIETFMSELPLWATDISVMMSGEFILAIFVAATTWMLSDYFAEMLEKMGLNQVLMRREINDPVENAAPPPREQILRLTISIGVVLVMFAALMRFDLRAATSGETVLLDLPPLAGGGATILLYFMFGLALFSLSQFMDLQSKWGLQSIPVSAGLAGRWAQYSLVFLIVLALLVSILPTSYSIGLLTTIGYVLNFIIGLLLFLAQVVVGIIVFIFNLPFMLFGRETPLENTAPDANFMPQMIPPAPDAGATVTPPWLEIFKAIIFWGILFTVTLLAVRQTLRQHQGLAEEMRRFRFLRIIANLIDWLGSFFSKAGAGVSEIIQKSIERLRPKRNLGKTLNGWINLRRLDPRHKIFFFYQAFLRRSNESGLPRSPSQTPTEYANRLDLALPEAEPDIETLTAAFIEARYTQRKIEPQSASLAQKTWDRIRKILRKNN